MIAAVGESLIDRMGSDELVGGCPLNVAIAASRLGASAGFYGKISSDEYGRKILESLIDSCVMFEPGLCGAPEPTLCSKAVLDEDGNASYVFDYKGTAACSVSQQELESSFRTMSDIDMVFMGSISLVMEPGCNAIVPAVHSIATRPKFFLDPNVRPALISDPEAYRKMIFSLVGECELVKASEDDIAFLYPDLDAETAEQRFAGLCEWNLVVTRGDRGSTWYSKFFRVDCPAVKVENVIDTIGCGDTFDAAIMAYLQAHDLVSEVADLDRPTIMAILEYASKAAALNCTKAGCNPPYGYQL